MQKNEGKIDRAIRAILGLIFLVLGYYQFAGATRIVFYVLAGVMFLTALTGFCSLYKVFGISTIKKDS